MAAFYHGGAVADIRSAIDARLAKCRYPPASYHVVPAAECKKVYDGTYKIDMAVRRALRKDRNTKRGDVVRCGLRVLDFPGWSVHKGQWKTHCEALAESVDLELIVHERTRAHLLLMCWHDNDHVRVTMLVYHMGRPCEHGHHEGPCAHQ
jgi:hypothetical protein